MPIYADSLRRRFSEVTGVYTRFSLVVSHAKIGMPHYLLFSPASSCEVQRFSEVPPKFAYVAFTLHYALINSSLFPCYPELAQSHPSPSTARLCYLPASKTGITENGFAYTPAVTNYSQKSTCSSPALRELPSVLDISTPTNCATSIVHIFRMHFFWRSRHISNHCVF